MRRFLPAIIILIIVGTVIFFLIPKKSEGEVKGVDTEVPQYESDKIDTYYGPTGLFDYEAMFKALDATVYPEDKYQGFPDPSYGKGSVIKVYRAMQVDIKDGKKRNTYRTWTETIGELLDEKGLELGDKDQIKPAISETLVRDQLIVITRVAETDIDVFEPIKFKTIKKNTPDLERGTNKTDQKGKNGKRKKVFHVRREDGEEVSRKLIKNEIVEESVDEIILVGTGPKQVHSGLFVGELNSASKKNNIDAPILQCLMMVESGGTPEAGFPDAKYKGLFQYEEGFWADISKKAGYGGASIYSATAQINTTAYALTHGYTGRWPTYKRCNK